MNVLASGFLFTHSADMEEYSFVALMTVNIIFTFKVCFVFHQFLSEIYECLATIFFTRLEGHVRLIFIDFFL